MISFDQFFRPEVFKQKTPCDNCPFRKVGGVRHGALQATAYISYFVRMPGTTFPCHKSVPKTDPRDDWSEWQQGQVLCSGGLIFTLKQRVMNIIMHAGLAAGYWDPAQYSEADKACVFDSVEEMLEAHDD